MITGRADGGGHLDDGALLRAIDRQLATDERDEIEAHLAACRACADARDTLARIAGEVTAALDGAITAPAVLPRARARQRRVPRPRAPRWLMAASVVFFALLATLAVPQARAFARDLWRMIRGPEPVVVDTSVRPVDPPREVGDRVLVEVTPTDSLMVIELSAEKSAGRISVEPHSSSRLVLRGVTTPPVLVFPSALRVSNESAPRADFRVLLPPTIRALVVKVRGRQVCRVGSDAVSECRVGDSR